MESNESKAIGSSNQQKAGPAKTIDLQGVAAFAGLVEMLAKELGTTPGRIQGQLPNGPASFEELAGEIVITSQGFQRTLTLFSKPGSHLTMKLNCSWQSGQTDGQVNGVECHYYLGASVDQILPQGRALARYIEDAFAVLDRMVTLGQAGKLSNMSVSNAQIEAFEAMENNLVSNTWVQPTAEPQRSRFDPKA